MNNEIIKSNNKNMKTIVFTGGGTAGHIIPNIALFPEAKKYFDRIVYIGTNGMEKDLIRKCQGVQFYEIEAVKLIRKLTFKNFKVPFKLYSSIKKSKKLLMQIKPDIIFSKGGYVSLPIVIAAKSLEIPVISHESDLSLGLANKIIYKYSSMMLTSFESTAEGKDKCVFVGSPIRDEILNGNKKNIDIHFNNNKKNVLFFGGSLGANAINEFIYNNLEKLTNSYNIIHLTGKGKSKKISIKNYYQQEFAPNIQDFFDLADIIVTRGGANALFEILALNKPMLIIPLPKSESRGDQIENAKYFKNHGYAEVLEQEELEINSLLEKLKLLEKQKVSSSKVDNANKKIMEIIVKNTKKG